MRRAGPLLLWCLVACAGTGKAHAAPPAPPLHYRLSIPDPASQWVHVELQVPKPRGESTTLAMPAWTPGSYLIRDFAKHVYDVHATDDAGRELAVSRGDKQTWHVRHSGKPFTVRYRVHADERSVRTSYVDDDEATLNGTSLFMYMPKARDRPLRLTLALPDGWEAHTSLPKVGPGPELAATDYDALVDAPLQLGTPQRKTFEVNGTRFEYVLAGAEGVGVDLDRLTRETEAIVTVMGERMGGFPMTRYLFLATLNDRGGGGLEHADSTMMMMRRSTFRSEDGYARAARLAAHEFFHLWNVKRIRDAALRPYDYGRENHTRLLWFHEGFTETAEGMAILQAGLVEPKAYVRTLGKTWTSYLRRPGRNYAPISEMSFDAWTHQYQPAPYHPNVLVSYYQKGNLIGVALDLVIRKASAKRGRPGDLFGVFRRLMKSHGQRGAGIELDDIVAAASAEAGEDLRWFFERYVDGTQELPLAELVQDFGIRVTSHAPWTNPDGSTKGRDEVADRVARAWAGWKLSGTRIDNIEPGSPADQADFMRDDELVAIDAVRVRSAEHAGRLLGALGPGKDAVVHVFRDGRLVERTLTVGENPHRIHVFELAPKKELSDEAAALRKAWIGA